MAPKKKTTKPKASLDTRIRTDAKLRARVLANPGLRSKLSLDSLQKYAPAQAKTRSLNIRLNAPITPGSSTTERDLAHEAQAAQTVRYQPQETEVNRQLGVAQQTERDTGALYDQYRAALDQHAQNIQAYQAGAQAALQQTQAGITGLGQQAAVQMQQQANAGAAQQGVAPAGDLTQLQNQALAQRQQIAGTFGAQQAMTGAAANTYADTLSNVVAPGQKITALAQARGRTADARQKLTDLKTEEGAFNQQFRDQRRQDEFKNVLAAQTLGVKAAADAADAAAKTPEAQAATQGAKSAASTAAKYGYTPHQWALLGPNGRQRVINAAKAQGKSKPDMGKVNKYGYTEQQWRAMSTSQRQKIIKDFGGTADSKDPNSKTASQKAFRDKYGVDLQGTGPHNTARDQVQNAQTAFGQVGKTVKQADGKPHKVTTDDVVAHLRDDGVPNIMIRAALEIARYGHILPGTAARLHKAGYSVAQLGFKTSADTTRRGGNRPRAGTSTAPAAGATTTSSQTTTTGR